MAEAIKITTTRLLLANVLHTITVIAKTKLAITFKFAFQTAMKQKELFMR